MSIQLKNDTTVDIITEAGKTKNVTTQRRSHCFNPSRVIWNDDFDYIIMYVPLFTGCNH